MLMNVKKKIRIITETYLRISQLHGVACESDYPPEARTKPIVVRSIFGEAQLSSGDMSQMIGQRLKEGLGIYDSDQEVLQAGCQICS